MLPSGLILWAKCLVLIYKHSKAEQVLLEAQRIVDVNNLPENDVHRSAGVTLKVFSFVSFMFISCCNVAVMGHLKRLRDFQQQLSSHSVEAHEEVQQTGGEGNPEVLN